MGRMGHRQQGSSSSQQQPSCRQYQQHRRRWRYEWGWWRRRRLTRIHPPTLAELMGASRWLHAACLLLLYRRGRLKPPRLSLWRSQRSGTLSGVLGFSCNPLLISVISVQAFYQAWGATALGGAHRAATWARWHQWPIESIIQWPRLFDASSWHSLSACNGRRRS